MHLLRPSARGSARAKSETSNPWSLQYFESLVVRLEYTQEVAAHDLCRVLLAHAARQQRRRQQAPIAIAAQHRLEVCIHIGADRDVIDAYGIDEAQDRVDVIRKSCLSDTRRP